MQELTADEAFELALTHHRAGRLAEAERAYRQILEHHPKHTDSLHLLGVVALQTGNLDPALELTRRAVALRPDAAIYRNTLGQVLDGLGRRDEARAAYETAVDLDPEYAEGRNNLGYALEREERLEEAEARYREAIRLDPAYAEPHSNLGNLLKERGELDEAIVSYRRAIERRPDLSLLHSNLLLTLHYHPDYSPADLAREHALWAERHVAPIAPRRRAHGNDPDPDRRLRIGYVSPDFREHAITRFMLPLLQAHDRRELEIFAYSDVPRPDEITQLVRERSDVWRDISAAGDAEVADVVRRDRVDVLVDLAAHSARNRLVAFAHKPAPVQVTYLAYCSTTGVDAIDYRLTDRYLDPPGTDPSAYTERSLYLPDCYWCYSAPALPPPRLPRAERDAGPPTFGCLNNFAKVTARTLELWARLLERVPEARLLLHVRTDAHRERVHAALRQAGVPETRVTFVGRQPFEAYLATYRSIDVALDPFPFAGGTTTCDALWMGVPVVSLSGRTAVSRAGSSLLANVGLEDLVAHSEQQYVELAAGLMRDAGRLAAMRRELRGRLESSPVMDVPRFARALEAKFRSIWRDWCERRTA